MATKTISFSNQSRSWSSSSRPTQNTFYCYVEATKIPLFATINSITPVFTHTATKTTGGSLLYYRTLDYYKTPDSITPVASSISISSGTSITDSTILGNNTLHAGNNTTELFFRALATAGSLFTPKLKTHTLSSVSITIDYTPLDYTIQLATRQGETGEDDIFYPAYNDRLFVGKDNGDGTATITLDTSVEKYSDYVFDHWEDGSTDPTRIISLTADATYTAIYRHTYYTVNYYDTTSGQDVLVNSQKCEITTSKMYIAPALPSYDGEISEGYAVNPIGWVLSKQGSIRPDLATMYLATDSNSEMTQYTTFVNLSTTDLDIVNLYFGFYPIQYKIDYFKYTKGQTVEALGTAYRLYNTEDYTLNNLPAPSEGYKLTNQMSEEHGSVDTSIINSWFVSNENMNPGDETISVISSIDTNSYDVYCYETPIDYTINYYNFSSGEDVLEYSINYLYDNEEQVPVLPTQEEIPEGYGVNPVGWVMSKQGSIRIDTEDMYAEDSTSLLLEQFSSILNLTAKDQDVINLYFGLYPIQYKIAYFTYTKNNSSSAGGTIEYRIYDNGDYILKDLPSSNAGYKLTNQMLEDHGAIDSTITNSWFTSRQNMRPGDETITTILSNTSENVTVYSYEDPIDFTVEFHTCDYDGTILFSEEVSCQYAVIQAVISKPEKLTGLTLQGWFSAEQDISDWYMILDTDTLYNNGETADLSFGTIDISRLTTTDQDKLNYYAYYIPQQYSVSYQWLDNWSPNSTEYVLPDEVTRIYKRDQLQIELIPDYEDYYIDNAGTRKWYYYEDDEQLTNEQDFVSPDIAQNIIFYANKTPKDRIITFSANDPTLGTIIPSPQRDDNIYQEGETIYCYVAPSENGFFSHWWDNSILPYSTIEVGSKNVDYKAYFLDNTHLGVLDVYVGTTPVKNIYLGSSKLEI